MLRSVRPVIHNYCDVAAFLPPQVPITLYFMTHAYFCFYHAVSNVLIRRVGRGRGVRV